MQVWLYFMSCSDALFCKCEELEEASTVTFQVDPKLRAGHRKHSNNCCLLSLRLLRGAQVSKYSFCVSHKADRLTCDFKVYLVACLLLISCPLSLFSRCLPP